MITYIISDIHLGSETCKSTLLLQFLKEIHNSDCKRLIINGDLFENTEHRLDKSHWGILSKLRKMSNDMEIVWCQGNHDYPDAETIAHLCGINLVNYYIFNDYGNSILCVHGDEWDKFLTNWPMLTNIADWFYRLLQRIDKSHNWAKFAKRHSKTFMRCVDKVKDGAVELALKLNCNVVITGHTHYKGHYIFSDNHVHYFNCGCWTELPCSFMKIDNPDKYTWLKSFNYKQDSK